MSGSEIGGQDRGADLRLLIPAAAGWLTAVLVVGAGTSTAVWVAVVAGVGIALGVLMLWQPHLVRHVSKLAAAERSRRAQGRAEVGSADHRLPARAQMPGRVRLPGRAELPAWAQLPGWVRLPGRAQLPGRMQLPQRVRLPPGRMVRQVVTTGVGVGVVVVGMALAAGLQVERLQAGPVMELAQSGAAVKVRLKVVGDPAVRSTAGSRRPPYVVVRATVEEVTGRGATTRVRTPVLVIGSVRWKEVRFGQHVEATGRLESVDKGGDVAAMFSSRVAPRVLDEPAWWLRAAERVRAGLRQAVAGEPPAVRGLVPALVMGDESAMPPELAEDFKTTGLTHLSAVSGALDLGGGMAFNFTRLP